MKEREKMEISSFPKAAAAPQSAPPALPNEASAVSTRAAVKNIFNGRSIKNNVMGWHSRTTWWVATIARSRLDMSCFGQDQIYWVPPPTFHERRKATGRTDGLRHLSPFFVCLPACLGSGFSWFPGSLRCVAQNHRILLLKKSIQWIHCSNACTTFFLLSVLFSHRDPMYCTLSF